MFWLKILQFFKLDKKHEETTTENFKICEEVAGNFHYHIHKEGTYKSLCGKSIMITAIPLSAWGTVTEHIKEKWCEECHEAISRAVNNESRS